MKLKTVGYYKEMPHGRDKDASIFDYIEREDEKAITDIVGYLESGIAFIVSPGGIYFLYESIKMARTGNIR